MASAVALIVIALSLIVPINQPALAAVPAPGPLDAKGKAIDQRFNSDIKPFLTENCFKCHANGKHKGDVTLDAFTSLSAIKADRKGWEDIQDMLQQHSMPPAKEPQPESAKTDAVAAWIDDAFDYFDAGIPRDPGRATIRRLNRNEYTNTIRDLVGVEFRAADGFPADDTGYGFDNIADVLTMSPLLLEKYLAAADKIVDLAIVTQDLSKPNIVRITGAEMEETTSTGPSSNSAKIIYTNGTLFREHEIRLDGEYEIRVKTWGEQAGPDPARMTLKIDKKDVKTYDVTAVSDKPQTCTQRIPLSVGKHRIETAYINNYNNKTSDDPKVKGDRNLVIESVEIEGPMQANGKPAYPESHRRIMIVPAAQGKAGEENARKIIDRFATRAFRRPATPVEISKLLALYTLARTQGDSFEQGIKLALSGVLVSPSFLFRIEQDPPAAAPGTIHNITDYELATRLSYFLWSNMPDDELFRLAGENKLHERAVLEAQIKRMLADWKATYFVGNFAGQWLELRNLEQVTPDKATFPKFDYQLKDSMRREPEAFFLNLVRNDGSVLDLLDCDYTFVNERLAKHYGITGVSGDQFKRVKLDGQHRGGVMTMAGVLTITSMPARTSPVKRGKWVLSALLGAAPPPPPPNVPALVEKKGKTSAANLRQRLEQHRADPTCASCHEKMDGIGFALENFDSVGVWRDKDGNTPVDTSGTLPGGKTFNGPDELKKIILDRKPEFVKNLTSKLMIYALGRGIETSDRATIKEIATATQKNDYKISTLIVGIVKSDQFLKGRTRKGDE